MNKAGHRKWPLLRGWLDEEREFLVGKQQLEQDLAFWSEAEPDDQNHALLSGLKLTRARGWLLERPHQLSDVERKFIQASLAFSEGEARKRERFRRQVQIGTTVAASALAVIALFAAFQWWVAGKERSRAQQALEPWRRRLQIGSWRTWREICAIESGCRIDTCSRHSRSCS